MITPFRDVGYAVRILAALSRRDPTYATATLLSKRTGLLRADLVRILRRLVDAGILDARRGVHGGYRLTRPTTSLTLLDVADAVLGLQWLPRCPLGHVQCPGPRACSFHEGWNRQRDALRRSLREIDVATAIDDMARRRRAPAGLDAPDAAWLEVGGGAADAPGDVPRASREGLAAEAKGIADDD